METKKDKLKEIHFHLMDGQRVHMSQLIDNYGLYDFFEDYNNYLESLYKEKEAIRIYFLDCVISYHRIKYR